jgi:hypothetical protein
VHLLAYEAYGVQFAIELESAEPRALAERVLPPGARMIEDGAGSSGRADLPRLTLEHSQELGEAAAVDRLAGELRQHVALHSPEVFIHAGVVAIGDSALLVPGHSGSGKTTLVAALLELGAEYLSDEYAVLDERGWVHPFPKPLSVREGRSRMPTLVAASKFGASTAPGPRRARLVARMWWTPGQSWAPRPVERGDGMMSLLMNTVAARTQSERALRRVRLLCEGATAIDGPRGEAPEAARELIGRLRLIDAGAGGIGQPSERRHAYRWGR